MNEDYLKGYILGLTEGEGCFSIPIQRYVDRKPRKTNNKNKIRKAQLFCVKAMFVITISAKDTACLEQVKNFFGVGRVYTQKRRGNKNDIAYYLVQGFESCKIVREFFQKQPFMTRKGNDFKNWCKCLDIVNSGGHLTNKRILAICDIRDQMNERKTKCKWTKEEVKKVLEEKPDYILAHHDQNQTSFLHNDSFSINKHLESKQGNNKASRPVLAQTELA